MKKIIVFTFLFLISVTDFSQTNCKVDKKSSKAEGTTFKVAHANWARFTKVIKDQDTSYYADFWSEGFTEDKYNHGVSFLFSDGTKHFRPEPDINCKLGPDGYYDFITHFKLTKTDVEILSKKIIVSFKLYNAERGIGESQGKKVLESMNCLIKAK